MKQYIRKADIILLIVLVALGLAGSAALAMHGSDSSDLKVVVKSDGEVYGSYPLSEDRTVVVPAPKQRRMDAPMANPEDEPSAQYDYYNVVVIKGGEVSVSEATCKNHICVRQGSVSKAGQSIICLPNRLVVSIEGGSGGEYDSITS